MPLTGGWRLQVVVRGHVDDWYAPNYAAQIADKLRNDWQEKRACERQRRELGITAPMSPLERHLALVEARLAANRRRQQAWRTSKRAPADVQVDERVPSEWVQW
jgi:hypothetical protein